jgi:DMSO/TMAO reductase YedYZ molybdopterin-dependent catalytic subunit
VEGPGADLVVRRADPLNCEVRLPRLADGAITPNDRFYIRNHFPVPTVDPRVWRLRVHGQVKSPLDFSMHDLAGLPSQALPVTLECAGNGRCLFNPPIDGEPWGLGAVSTAEWTGVQLSEILDRVGVEATASHLVFRSADSFERGLGVETSVLLAYAMNGAPLPAIHGFPLRAVVPDWYAVAGVKWLTEIEVTDRPFAGYYQVERYVFDRQTPVTQVRVRSLITHPEDGATMNVGELAITGLAWSGTGPVERVEVRVDGGAWVPANLGASERYAWRRWDLVTSVDGAGDVVIRSRATDAAGNTQPEHAEWNRLGYGNNSIQAVSVRAR